MSNDFHNKPFEDSTKTKLELYKRYVEEWLPVFVSNSTKNINIFDFFCGPGLDKNGNLGSPLLAIETIKKYKDLLLNKNSKVNLFLNDNNERKINNLSELLESRNLKYFEYLNIYITKKKFEDVFDKYYSSKMVENNSSNLIFIDQTGIKHVNKDRFIKMVRLDKTDFLFFISSLYIKRFIKEDSFNNYFGTFTKQIVDAEPREIHRVVAKFYEQLKPKGLEIYLIPFTLKKKNNYYGLIFGTKNILGAEKFLKICWDKDKITGDANFDIDNTKIELDRPALFDEMNKSTKLNEFERVLSEKIINNDLTNNIQVYKFTISNAFLAEHARHVIKRLKEDKVIENTVHVSYDSCIKKRKEEIINVIKQ